MISAPYPGSAEAGVAGCTCPLLDNGHGRGRMGDDGSTLFWVDDNCRLHGSHLAAVRAPTIQPNLIVPDLSSGACGICHSMSCRCHRREG
jgi:hypothetical protein